MACQFESKMFELNELPAAERALVQEHLAECADCGELARQLQEADACLERAIQAPSLSRQFTSRLHQRIQAEHALLTESERAERKHQAQAEFQADLARLRRSCFGTLQIMDGVGWAAVALVAGWMLSLGLMSLVKAHPIEGAGWFLGIAILAGALFAGGLAAAFSGQTRRFWTEE